MEIAATQGAGQSGAKNVQGQAQAGNAGATTLNSDFETFLKMLTAQMQNQDPLNPVDSADFATQLAAFSSVEQQVRTNDLLSSLGGQLGALGIGQLLGWVGMSARAQMPVAFDGTPVSLTLKTEAGTDLARLVVRDARGGIVQELNVPAEGGSFSWTGKAETGTPLPDGLYDIEVHSFRGEAMIGSNVAESQARIVEARNATNGTVLVMESGAEIDASQVIGLRSADAG